MNILTRKIKIIVIVNHYKINLFINILKEFGFNIQFILNYSINELEKDPFENYLILGNNLELVSSLNNFFNHMEYLPLDYDYCQLLINIPPIIIKQYNSYYYNVKKYKFETENICFISKSGIKKILKNKEYMSIYDCYKNINNFNFYTINKNFPIFRLA